MVLKKLFLVLGLMQPLVISARNIRPIDVQESDLDAGSFKIWLLFLCGFIILCFIALIAEGIIAIRNKINKKHPKPYSLDKGGYIFVCFTNSKSFKEPGEQPKSTYKSIGKATQDHIFIKDGKYFYDWCGKFLPVEESPYFGDANLGEWGTYKYRYKVVYENTKYCQQGWCYHYFNIPSKDD